MENQASSMITGIDIDVLYIWYGIQLDLNLYCQLTVYQTIYIRGIL